MWLEAGAAVPAIAAAVLGYAAKGRSSRLFGPNIWRGPRHPKQIALTFNDGPSESTEQVLDILDVFSIRATFFQCGKNVQRLPAISRQVKERGHEIGNHTHSHPYLLWCSPARICEEIAAAQKAIADAAGVEPRLFRAPYGLRWFGLRSALREHNLTGVMWTVMGYDWEWEATEIAAHVLAHASPGGIICLHDGNRTATTVDRRNTILALRKIIPQLHQQGYSFVTVGDMIAH